MVIALMSGASLCAFAQSTQAQVQAQSQDRSTLSAASEQNQQGYHDGMQAAQLDKAAKRKIDAKSSHLYVHPPVKGAARDEYRSSFVAGYEAALKHDAGE